MEYETQDRTPPGPDTRSETEQPSLNEPGALTPEGLLERMDAIGKELLDLKETIRSTELTVPADNGVPDSSRIAAAVSEVFTAREKTCQQQLALLGQMYNDRFSPLTEADKTARMNMILDKMNSAISMLDPGEGGTGSVNAVIRFYSDLLEKI